MAAAVVASSFVASSLAVHQVALLVESGHSGAFAAAATGLLGAMQVPGRLLFGPLRSRRGRAQSTVAVYGAFAVGVLVLAVATSTAAVVVFVAVYGMARGMLTLLRAALIGDLWGTADYGAISGVLAMASTGATALGPVVVAVGHDRFGSYTASRWAMVVMAVVAMVAAARVEPLTRRAAPPTTAPPVH
jgi:MFS family permease